ncbi:MAG: NUDIX domain-containing protein [Phycisphaeraceae bacterium]|nr:NUDIX domain-containing protein [Phycisphaeraceae bacterium]MCW5769825.1 NUDIX domain-containing protein [Phycisphaeraceae bacterium]
MHDRASTCRAWTLAPDAGLRFRLQRSSSPGSETIDRAWKEMCAENERLFDGWFLSVEDWSPPETVNGRPGTGRAASPGLFSCRVERYRRLAVAGSVPECESVRLLALTGVVTARDRGGIEHVLMGLRAAKTRMYGGLWEFAPAGGVDPPGEGQTFDALLLRRVLVRELEEEVGLPAEALGACDPVMVVLNEEARSYDVVMRTKLVVGLEEARRRITGGSWEYERVEWVPVSGVHAFVRDHQLVPQGREMVRVLASDAAGK